MTDINHAEQKTRKVGNISLAAVKRMKTWEDYMAKAATFSIAKGEMEHAKDAMREALKVALKGKNLPRGVKVGDDADLDFTIVGHEVKVIELLQKKGGRTKSIDDLSAWANPNALMLFLKRTGIISPKVSAPLSLPTLIS